MTCDRFDILPGVNVSRETMDRLRSYEALVRKWSPAVNLVAAASLDEMWSRHILDSAQLFRISPQNPQHWVDLGSGAGFPGVVMAVLFAELPSETRFTLIESDKRKAAFLQTCARELSLSLDILPLRIEEVAPLMADVVSARALAPLPRLLELVHRHLSPTGTALLLKGQSARSEVADAEKTWKFELCPFPSQTNSAASVLRLKGISRA